MAQLAKAQVLAHLEADQAKRHFADEHESIGEIARNHVEERRTEQRPGHDEADHLGNVEAAKALADDRGHD